MKASDGLFKIWEREILVKKVNLTLATAGFLDILTSDTAHVAHERVRLYDL